MKRILLVILMALSTLAAAGPIGVDVPEPYVIRANGGTFVMTMDASMGLTIYLDDLLIMGIDPQEGDVQVVFGNVSRGLHNIRIITADGTTIDQPIRVLRVHL